MTTYTTNGVTLSLVRGNIVDMQVDAIVNAANKELAGGGGVDGAIHRAGGPTIMEECQEIGGCATGSAVATSAGKLQASYIFHAVAPIYKYYQDKEGLLARAYQSCLNLAEQYQIKSIAFPSLGTGVYSYPLHLAAPIAVSTTIAHIQKATSLQQITFVLFDAETYAAFERALIQQTESK